MSEPVIFIAEPRLRRDVTTISIVGLGPVGLCSGVAFATQGHRVLAVDIDPKRREQVGRGRPPFYEKGIEAANLPFRLGMNPEFLREGRALEDALRPDRIVLGADGPETARILKGLYRSAKCPIFSTDVKTAEAVKYATNAFLATKVAFADELANLCDAFGISYDEVHKGLGLDPRINPRFLVPGVGFGGSCFPKDVRALVAAGRRRGVEPILLEGVLAQNDVQYLRSIAKLEEELRDLRGKRIALLGLAFKGDTDDVRETRAVPIARTLVSKGALVVGYDPLAGPAVARLVPEGKIVGSAKEALARAGGAILQADWPAFSRLTPKDFVTSMATPVVVDGRRILDPKKMRGVRFHRIG